MHVLGCVAAGLEDSLHKVEQANEAANVTLNSWLLVIAGAMVFFMQVRIYAFVLLLCHVVECLHILVVPG